MGKICFIIQSVAQSHHIEHVRYLLRKGRLPWSEQNLQHLSLFSKERFLANFAFRRIPGFKFPTRVLATFTITVLAVYQVRLLFTVSADHNVC